MARSLAAIGLGLSVLDGLSCGPILFEGLGGHQGPEQAKTPNLSGVRRNWAFPGVRSAKPLGRRCYPVSSPRRLAGRCLYGSERAPAMKFSVCPRSVCAAVFLFVCSCFAPRSSGSNPGITSPAADSQSSEATIQIPGPMRSFLRMAGISQKAAPDEVIPLLARNVFLLGYEGPSAHVRPTEFLILLSRYVQQARELDVMAGAEGVLHVSNCEQAKPLLQVLGYRTRTDCGQPGSYLETADPQRAFITVDSGFPIPELEKTLQGGPAFAHPFRGSRIPVLFSEADWAGSKNLLDSLLRDSALSRLYWAFAQMDPETQAVLRQSPGLKRLLPYGPVLDFYGSRVRIRSGRVLVPGGARAESVWRDLVGVAPDASGDFVLRLASKDNGWLAAYFDALSRVNPTQQAHFTEARRLRPFYEALRHPDTPPAEAA